MIKQHLTVPRDKFEELRSGACVRRVSRKSRAGCNIPPLAQSRREVSFFVTFARGTEGHQISRISAVPFQPSTFGRHGTAKILARLDQQCHVTYTKILKSPRTMLDICFVILWQNLGSTSTAACAVILEAFDGHLRRCHADGRRLLLRSFRCVIDFTSVYFHISHSPLTSPAQSAAPFIRH